MSLFALLGIANQAIYLGVGYVGLRDVSAGLSVLIFSANPIVTAVLAALVLGERMTWRKVVGLVLGIAGVAFIVQSRLVARHRSPARNSAHAWWRLLSFVGGTILFKRYAPKDGLVDRQRRAESRRRHRLVAFCARLSRASATSCRAGGCSRPSPSSSLLVSVFAYLLWFRILTVSGATAASSYYFLMPPLGMLFGWLLLGEHVALVGSARNHSGRARHLPGHAAGPGARLKNGEQ